MQKIFYGIFLFFITLQIKGGADCTPGFAIAGGNNDNDLNYGILISPAGVPIPFSGPGYPRNVGFIYSVAINSLGYGVFGGDTNFYADPYIGLVSPSGVTTALSGYLPQSNGYIWSVNISDSGTAIIGGTTDDLYTPYVALVSPTGVATALSGSALPQGAGGIWAVAINASNHSIIGGEDNGGIPYLALVSPSGVTTALSGSALPQGSGWMNWVDMNSSGNAIVGGQHNSNIPYAALVSPSGVTTAMSGDVPQGNGSINAVAINSIGNGIIGGMHQNNSAFYVGIVSPSGVITAMSGDTPPIAATTIYSVGINSSGIGIVGGASNTAVPYVAFVSPTGVATAVTGFSLSNLYIHAVDISSSGVAIIGGGTGTYGAYLAIVSPSGALTEFNLAQGYGYIYSVDISSCEEVNPDLLFSSIDPGSFGAGNAFANPLFALSSFILENGARNPKRYGSKIKEDENNFSLVADASDRIYYMGKRRDRAQQKYVVWFSSFGSYARLKKHDVFPTIRDRNMGALLGFDYNGWKEGMIGGGLAYVFQDIHYSQNFGKGKVNQEFATLYGAWYGPYVTVEAALWGGLYQFRNHRKTLGFITSKSVIHGWLFAPHVSVQGPIGLSDGFFMTPFVQFDWVNNWQGKVREHGRSGLNLRVGSHYVSVLRSEVGLRLTEYKKGAYGTFKFEEGASYVNQAPFNAKKVSAYYVGSISTFNLQMFSDKVENLGALYLGGWFIPKNLNLPEVGLNYQGEWGSKFFSQTLALEVTQRF
jgi:hypothetical protein